MIHKERLRAWVLSLCTQFSDLAKRMVQNKKEGPIHMKRIMSFWLAVLICALMLNVKAALAAEPETVDIQILATSDLHGMFYPWDYTKNIPAAGSMAQLKTVVDSLRTENTLVLDAGDVIEGNQSEIFLNDDNNVLVECMNFIGYDAITTGNHEYNHGIATLKKIIAQHKAEVLTGNVWDSENRNIGKPYVIFERGGVRIAVIGMVTPNIVFWDAKNLEDCTVTDPVEETRRAIDELQGQADILIGLMHMGVDNEYELPHSGVADLANVCPELDLIIAAHDHQAIEKQEINGIPVVENENQAETLCEIHLTVKKTDEGCEVTDTSTRIIQISEYEPNAEMKALLMPYHERVLEYMNTVIGRLEGGDLTLPNDIQGIPQTQIEDSALIDLINTVQLYYSGAKVSSCPLTSPDSVIKEGELRRYDISKIYSYNNYLYTLKMSGAQLKAYMEWSANYYQQYRDGDLTIAFNPEIRSYLYDMFDGVNYEIDVSNPEGERIVNLTWPDGTPVTDEDEFLIAVSNYRSNTFLLNPGEIYEAGETPRLMEADIGHADISSLIMKYITEVCGGMVRSECNQNWRIIGNDWDSELHQEAVEQINSGRLKIEDSVDDRIQNVRPITVSDLNQ